MSTIYFCQWVYLRFSRFEENIFFTIIVTVADPESVKGGVKKYEICMITFSSRIFHDLPGPNIWITVVQGKEMFSLVTVILSSVGEGGQVGRGPSLPLPYPRKDQTRRTRGKK